jgi:hypothetical protein
MHQIDERLTISHQIKKIELKYILVATFLERSGFVVLLPRHSKCLSIRFSGSSSASFTRNQVGRFFN